MTAKKISCTEVARRLQSYLDGELDDDRMAQIRAHLDACVHCGLDEEVFSAIKSDLNALSAPAESGALARLREFSASLSEGASPAQ